MKLSKLPFLLLTSFSLLASVALLSCSNSTGSGGGKTNPDDVSGNIIAKAVDKGIEITAKNLSGNSRIDIYRKIGEDKKIEQWLYMDNYNSEDTITIVDNYVNIDESYTYVLAINGNREESNTVKATHGRGELEIELDAKEEGIELAFGGLAPAENYFEIWRHKKSDPNMDLLHTIEFSPVYNENTYIDPFVEAGTKYIYEARMIVKGDQSGGKPTQYVYTRPTEVTPTHGDGEIDLANTPVATYDSTENTMTFTTAPKFTPDYLNTGDFDYHEIGFYIDGSGIGSWDGEGDIHFGSGKKGKINGYCIYFAFKNGTTVFSYHYNQGNNEKISGLPSLTN